MKKKDGQKNIVENLYPTLIDKETEKKLAQIEIHSEAAKIYNDLMAEVKDTIKGFVLGLSESDQEVGKLQCGDFILGFKVTKRVRIKFGKEEEKEE
jgi:hypothetical protein